MPLGAIAVLWNRIKFWSRGANLASDRGACTSPHGKFQLLQKSRGVQCDEEHLDRLELTEEEILFFKMPDEALEIVAGAAKQMTNFSIGYCSALSVCDG
jgi:hypothetical protein